jgi:hypothetical protein
MVRSVVGGIARFAGTAARPGAAGQVISLDGVSGTSARACTAVGTIGGQSMITVTLALRTG